MDLMGAGVATMQLLGPHPPCFRCGENVREKYEQGFAMTGLREHVHESTVRGRLFSLINSMTAGDQLTLLNLLEERLYVGKRKHRRKPFSMVVDYAAEDRAYRDYIQNISAGGVFIETRMPFAVGQQVTLSFPLPNQKNYIRITGQVVRTSPQGIGVKFTVVDQEQEEMISALLEMI
jgi:uncharacterized protein (TIGR02266 family)